MYTGMFVFLNKSCCYMALALWTPVPHRLQDHFQMYAEKQFHLLYHIQSHRNGNPGKGEHGHMG